MLLGFIASCSAIRQHVAELATAQDLIEKKEAEQSKLQRRLELLEGLNARMGELESDLDDAHQQLSQFEMRFPVKSDLRYARDSKNVLWYDDPTSGFMYWNGSHWVTRNGRVKPPSRPLLHADD